MLGEGFYNMDCLEGMKHFPDGYFDLAIVDPPYFSGPEKRGHYGRLKSKIGVVRQYEKTSNWEKPTKVYFDELFRVSKAQIVWGCNYFDHPFEAGRIVWDKCNGKSSFSDAEIAFCSLHSSTRLFRYLWNGMFQGKSISEGAIQRGDKSLNEERIHPTQKPVELYKWLLTKYAQSHFKILDTHVGSASSLIAFEEAGLSYVGFEIDQVIYKKAKMRLENYRRQLRMQLEDYFLFEEKEGYR